MAAQKGQQLAMAECRLPAKGRLSLLKEKKVVGTDGEFNSFFPFS